ncbi:MAG: uroporphyrinogen-III synthase [Bacteroidetes bacterium]|nr:MAG: uroporphyrinogen-III synthase [Bacteroidota bacterium]
MPSVFLSRDQRSAGLFVTLMQKAGWSVQAVSLLVFRAEPFDLPPQPLDWLFFYSRKGVRFWHRAGKAPPEGCRIAAMGQGTAAELERLDWEVDFVGEGHPTAVAKAFGKVAAGQRVAFMQARHSRQSVEKALAEQVEVLPVVVYDNVPKSEFTVRPADYLVFTSPLNFATYRQHYSIMPASRYVAIGATTARAFTKAGVPHFRVAGTPSEQGLAACVLAWEAEEPRVT